MWTRRCLVVAFLLSAATLLAVACGGEDERQTPNCDQTDCFTEADGGTPLNIDGGAG